MARPALAVGISLALLETLNDIGASEFLGVQTLTVTVYTTWISRSDLSAAAQIACMMLMFIFLILTLEFYGRRKQGFSSRSLREIQPSRVQGWRGWLLGGVISMPVVLGFLAPVLFLMWESAKRIGDENPFSSSLLSALQNRYRWQREPRWWWFVSVCWWPGARAIAPQTTPCRDFVAA